MSEQTPHHGQVLLLPRRQRDLDAELSVTPLEARLAQLAELADVPTELARRVLLYGLGTLGQDDDRTWQPVLGDRSHRGQALLEGRQDQVRNPTAQRTGGIRVVGEDHARHVFGRIYPGQRPRRASMAE